MAKPKFPKKTNDANQTAFTPNIPGVNVDSPQAGSSHVTAPPTHSAQAASASPQSSSAQSGSAAGAASAKTENKRTSSKPEIVRPESRANLVPINIEEEIRRLAYLLSERRGFQGGHETEDWLAAEREIRQRYRQQSA